MKEVVIKYDNFDVAVEYNKICRAAPRAGAVVFFVGLVRDLYLADDVETIEYIELEHYPGMTEVLCQQIIDDARAKYLLDAVRIVHRVGKILASEQIVMVAVASRHRDNAFQAAQFIMDYLKARATIWKKEVGVRGEYWVEMKDKDKQALKRWDANE